MDPTIRKVPIIHNSNTAHNHPMPALTKASFELKAAYRKCIEAAGCVRATVSKVDNAPSTKILLDGKKPSEFAAALQLNQTKRKMVCKAKLAAYPPGLDVGGVFQLFWDEMKKPIDERYIHRIATMPDGRVIILTCLAALMRLLDDKGVLSFENDTTFKRVAGDINEWEVVIFFKALQRAVTIARGYVNHASAKFFERLYDEFQAVKLELTGKPVGIKCFVPEVLGAARYFFKLNDPEYSNLSNDTPGEEVAPEFDKLCTTHGKRGLLEFKSLVSEQDHKRLMDFMYINSEEKLDDFSEFSPMSTEDWDKTPSTTNTSEAQHHWTNSRTGIKLYLVEAIEMARKVDKDVVGEIETLSHTVTSDSLGLRGSPNRNIPILIGYFIHHMLKTPYDSL
ncbi:hypothetical protein B0H10DRAFT_2232608 [Mycena sp. CBHHK59/15]|nr:hypothetical protein B0H10DRAFT_2232608 [Mycena sp. CBHHK59/15]